MSMLRNRLEKIRAKTGGEDIGLDRGSQQGRQRALNRDGSYNMERITDKPFDLVNLYHWLITTSWKHYWIVVSIFYFSANIIFGTTYFLLGEGALGGVPSNGLLDRWLYSFFFSTQSFTTVGYGGIHPLTKAASFVAAIEAFTGLMTFALATGTLYGRFSKPRPAIKYSPKAIIASYHDGTALMFMVANEKESSLMEMEARINFSWTQKNDPTRKFVQIKLEIDKIAMFPTSWTVVHPIDEDSPMWNKSKEEIKEMDIELFILLKGFDETFSQTIYSRGSYIGEEIVWGAKYRRPFSVNQQGKLVMDLTKVGDYDIVTFDVPQQVAESNNEPSQLS